MNQRPYNNNRSRIFTPSINYTSSSTSQDTRWKNNQSNRDGNGSNPNMDERIPHFRNEGFGSQVYNTNHQSSAHCEFSDSSVNRPNSSFTESARTNAVSSNGFVATNKQKKEHSNGIKSILDDILHNNKTSYSNFTNSSSRTNTNHNKFLPVTAAPNHFEEERPANVTDSMSVLDTSTKEEADFSSGVGRPKFDCCYSDEDETGSFDGRISPTPEQILFDESFQDTFSSSKSSSDGNVSQIAAFQEDLLNYLNANVDNLTNHFEQRSDSDCGGNYEPKSEMEREAPVWPLSGSGDCAAASQRMMSDNFLRDCGAFDSQSTTDPAAVNQSPFTLVSSSSKPPSNPPPHYQHQVVNADGNDLAKNGSHKSTISNTQPSDCRFGCFQSDSSQNAETSQVQLEVPPQQKVFQSSLSRRSAPAKTSERPFERSSEHSAQNVALNKTFETAAGDGGNSSNLFSKFDRLTLTSREDKVAMSRRSQLPSTESQFTSAKRGKNKFVKAPELSEYFFNSPKENKSILMDPSESNGVTSGLNEVERWGNEFQDMYNLKYTKGETYIDSHCHIDFLFKRHHMRKEQSWHEYNSNNFPFSPETFEGFVSVYCEPYAFKDYKSYPYLLRDSSVNCVAAFGIHPHSAHYYNDALERELMIALDHPKCTGLGEIGLDYSERASGASNSVQKEVLVRQIKLCISKRKTLLLHCRDADEDMNAILKQYVPREYPIHRHCFTEDKKLLHYLLKEFPNMYFGFTNLISLKSAWDPREAAREVPLYRLLLETDAPYFMNPAVPKKLQYSHPSMAIYVADKIAQLKDCPIDRILSNCRRNTKYLYQI